MKIPSPIPLLQILALCVLTFVLLLCGVLFAIVVMLGMLVNRVIADVAMALRRLFA